MYYVTLSLSRLCTQCTHTLSHSYDLVFTLHPACSTVSKFRSICFVSSFTPPSTSLNHLCMQLRDVEGCLRQFFHTGTPNASKCFEALTSSASCPCLAFHWRRPCYLPTASQLGHNLVTSCQYTLPGSARVKSVSSRQIHSIRSLNFAFGALFGLPKSSKGPPWWQRTRGSLSLPSQALLRPRLLSEPRRCWLQDLLPSPGSTISPGAPHIHVIPCSYPINRYKDIK